MVIPYKRNTLEIKPNDAYPEVTYPSPCKVVLTHKILFFHTIQICD